jgi:hypothetical protein
MQRAFIMVMTLCVMLFGIGIGVQAQEERQGLSPEAIRKISESVVFILAAVDGEPISTGSGTIVEPSGLIYTNHHVVEGANDFEIYVTRETGELPESIGFATVVRAFNEIDFAILQIDRDPEGRPIDPLSLNLPALNRGAREVQLGDHITVFGYPGVGDGFLVITQGSVTSVENANLFDRRVPLWYRTDAEISPGNSGGLVVDDSGAFLGIPTMVRAEERTLGRLGGILPFVAVETVLSAYEAGMIPDSVNLTVNNTSGNQEICYLFVSPTTASEWGPDMLGNQGTIPPGESFTLAVEPGIYDVLMQDCSGNELEQLPQRDITSTAVVNFPSNGVTQGGSQSLSIDITSIEYDVAVDDGGELGFKVHTTINAVGYMGQDIRAGVFYYFADGTPVSCENMAESDCDPNGNLTVQAVLTPSFEDTIWDDYWFWVPYSGMPDGLSGRVNFEVIANVGPDGAGVLENTSEPEPVVIEFSGGQVTPDSDLKIDITSMEFDVAGDRSSESGVKTYVDFSATGYQGVEIRVALFFYWADGTPILCPVNVDDYYCTPDGSLTVQEVVTPSYEASEWNGYWMHVPYSAFPTGLRGTQPGYVIANIAVNGTGEMNNPSAQYNFDLFYN